MCKKIVILACGGSQHSLLLRSIFSCCTIYSGPFLNLFFKFPELSHQPHTQRARDVMASPCRRRKKKINNNVKRMTRVCSDRSRFHYRELLMNKNESIKYLNILNVKSGLQQLSESKQAIKRVKLRKWKANNFCHQPEVADYREFSDQWGTGRWMTINGCHCCVYARATFGKATKLPMPGSRRSRESDVQTMKSATHDVPEKSTVRARDRPTFEGMRTQAVRDGAWRSDEMKWQTSAHEQIVTISYSTGQKEALLIELKHRPSE
jgi:hypothetical protein